MGFRELARDVQNLGQSHSKLIDAHNHMGKVVEGQGKVLGEIVKEWNEWHGAKRTIWQRIVWIVRGK
jgi:hypothetical protein